MVMVPVYPAETLPESDGVCAAICADVLEPNTLSVEVDTAEKLLTLPL